MRRWISILLIIALVGTGGFFWKKWLPPAAAFVLQRQQPISLRGVGVFLLKHTDPAMKNISRYLAREQLEAPDEQFLYFTEAEQPLLEDPSIQAANLSALSGTYHQFDGTAVVNGTDFDITDILKDSVKSPSFTDGKPAVLIYHTHTTECYRNSEGISNTKEESQNVVAVGKAMKEEFEAAGYPTIHIKDVFNTDFSNAYPTARAAIQKVLKENPTIQVVLDVHRDSISSGGVDFYPVTQVEGKDAAQIMFVCGTDAKGMDHPRWRRNFTYALELSRRMGKLYGQLSRPVNLRADRFNTHFTDYTLLVEVGSAANTLEQAVYGGRLTARAMMDLWKNP